MPTHEWTENRPSTRRVPLPDWRELSSHRELALFLALRDLQLRYKQTLFGVAWAVLQPLAGAAIFTVVLGRLAGLQSDGLPYAVFVYSGFVAWTYLGNSLDGAAKTLVEDEALVTKIYFPRLLAPAAAVLPPLVDLGISLIILGCIMALTGVAPTLALLTAPLWLLALVLLAFGVGAFLSALNVKYRDVRHALPFGIQTWLFASPVVYPVSLVDGALRYVYAANPVVGILEGFRWSVAGGPPPGPEAVVSLVVGMLAALLGVIYFQATERRFADVI